ncbi:D-alanine--D-alanine ligase family protein [Pseudochryseolinea flava]|uniref:D-alanine--D-alanine ligase n=1 Tax=Pseudochryseolinea flava TaxID=2059302 RepID=A0A364XX06_9BACT|nr:D-alanine--D-alanine ligase family protein [Pseudochryseolinea flava]RAV98062.1 D-alanine--D-alanine ligase A [Pseudochryseolinea flava]
MPKKKKVVILYGGRSVEHGVSINSARNIFENIDKKQFEPIPIGISTTGQWYLTTGVNKDIKKNGQPLALSLDPAKPAFINLKTGKRFQADIIFPVLHGTDGEDGSIQGLVKVMDVPMVGTGVLGSSTAMNKIVAKRLLRDAGLPVTDFVTFTFDQKDKISFNAIAKRLGTPFMVKSASLGSSVGVSKVNDKKDFKKAVEEAFKYDHEMIAEAYVKGREIECAILGNNPPEASLPGEVVISKDYEFYTFDAKYVDPNAVRIDVPAKLPKNIVEKIRKASVQAFEALHCEDFSRIDLFLDEKGNIYVNEINSIPGFTNSSMYPVMWQERGIGFKELITRLLDLAQERYDRSKRIARDFQSSLKF